MYKDPESKAEKAVNLIKENIIPLKKEESKLGEEMVAAAFAAVKKEQEVKKDVKTSVDHVEIKIKSKSIIDQVEKKATTQTATVSTTTTTTIETETQQLAKEPGKKVETEVRLTLWQRIVKELKHYYDGFRLLGLETKIAYGLAKKVLSGHTLTRRERKQVMFHFF